MSAPQPNISLPKKLYKTLGSTSVPISLLLKGASGTGKTWSACHFPRPLLISFDNNTSGILDIGFPVQVFDASVDQSGKRVPKEQVWNNFVKALDQFIADPDIDTIILDSLTTMSSFLCMKVLGTAAPERNLEIQHWGEFQRFLRSLIGDLCTNASIKKHIVVLAHETKVTEKEDKSLNARELFKGYELLIPTKIKDELELLFTDVIRTGISNGQIGATYEWYPQGTQHFSAKTTLKCLKKDGVPLRAVGFNSIKSALQTELKGRLV